MIRKSYYIFGTVFLIFLVAFYLYQRSFNRTNEYTKWVNHSYRVISLFEQLSSSLKTAQMLPTESGNKHRTALLELFKNDINSIPVNINRLRALTSDNKSQQAIVDSLAFIIRGQLQWMLTLDLPDSIIRGNQPSYFAEILKTQRLIDTGIDEERKLLEDRRSVFENSVARTDIFTVIFICVSFLIILAMSYSNINHLRRRQTVESFLESVLNTSRNGIVTYEAIREDNQIVDFRIIFANESFQKQIGVESTDLVGKTLLEVFPSAMESKRMENYRRVSQTGKKDEFEVSYQIGNNLRWYSVMLAKLEDGFTATFYDITALKSYHEELQRKVHLLEHANSELEQFAYVASHDLQEPLRKIKTFTSIILDRFNEPAESIAKSYMVKVISSADRMSTLIRDLLNMTDISHQHKSFVKTDLNVILKEVLNDFELIIQEKKATIKNDLLPVVEAIPLQMSQLLYNLINNALKFSRENTPPEVSITFSRLTGREVNFHNLDEEISYYEIVIRDNGIGFNPEYAEKIFIIFQRLNSRQAYSGSGIGLALCRKIVQKHGGKIYVRSKENEGASFHIILPAYQNVTMVPEEEELKLIQV